MYAYVEITVDEKFDSIKFNIKEVAQITHNNIRKKY